MTKYQSVCPSSLTWEFVKPFVLIGDATRGSDLAAYPVWPPCHPLAPIFSMGRDRLAAYRMALGADGNEEITHCVGIRGMDTSSARLLPLLLLCLLPFIFLDGGWVSGLVVEKGWVGTL